MSIDRQPTTSSESLFTSIVIAIVVTWFWVVHTSEYLPIMIGYIDRREVINYALHLIGAESIPLPTKNLLIYCLYLMVPVTPVGIALGSIYEYLEQRVSKDRVR